MAADRFEGYREAVYTDKPRFLDRTPIHEQQYALAIQSALNLLEKRPNNTPVFVLTRRGIQPYNFIARCMVSLLLRHGINSQKECRLAMQEIVTRAQSDRQVTISIQNQFGDVKTEIFSAEKIPSRLINQGRNVRVKINGKDFNAA